MAAERTTRHFLLDFAADFGTQLTMFRLLMINIFEKPREIIWKIPILPIFRYDLHDGMVQRTLKFYFHSIIDNLKKKR